MFLSSIFYVSITHGVRIIIFFSVPNYKVFFSIFVYIIIYYYINNNSYTPLEHTIESASIETAYICIWMQICSCIFSVTVKWFFFFSKLASLHLYTYVPKHSQPEKRLQEKRRKIRFQHRNDCVSYDMITVKIITMPPYTKSKRWTKYLGFELNLFLGCGFFFSVRCVKRFILNNSFHEHQIREFCKCTFIHGRFPLTGIRLKHRGWSNICKRVTYVPIIFYAFNYSI